MFFLRCSGLSSQCCRLVPACGLGRGALRGHSHTKLRATAAAPARLSHSGLGELYDNSLVQRYLQKLMEEHRVLSRRLQRDHLSDPDRKALLKKQTELLPVADAFGSLEEAQKDLEEVRSLLLHTKDEDEQLVQLLREEEAQIWSNLLTLRKQLIKAVVPVDPLDSSDVVLEVVSGRTTGGDICQQFTAEVFDMYQGFACFKNWEFEVLNYSPAEYGGLHHAAVRIAGESVYRRLKHEGGTHRVQRIPEVGLSSRMQRIHTGTMTVIVLPQPVELDVHVDPKDLRIDTFRARGPGGQGVNTTDSAVRIVHLPTGIAAECQQSRSQQQNKNTAMRVLRARLYQSRTGRETQQRHTARKQQVGTRSQAERIRTYNFSQDRVTDHRTGYTTRDIKEFMKGGQELEDLISHLLDRSEQEAVLEAAEAGGRCPPSSPNTE